MKKFSFIAGHPADDSRGMTLVVDRSALPPDMKLGLLLDDDGKAIPGFDRGLAKRGHAGAGCDSTELVLLERVRIRARVGGMDGILTVEPGTRFDAALGGGPLRAEVDGGEIALRGGQRLVDVRAPRARVTVDKAPSAAHVFTLVADKPAGARPGERFPVEVTQYSSTGERCGAVAVMFTFD
ncbi:MAG: hypothetical protein IT375_16530 [Polyangiaceae bacterium]|nr:hypothetical protein [Polyangiaceae bacterium]